MYCGVLYTSQGSQSYRRQSPLTGEATPDSLPLRV